MSTCDNSGNFCPSEKSSVWRNDQHHGIDPSMTILGLEKLTGYPHPREICLYRWHLIDKGDHHHLLGIRVGTMLYNLNNNDIHCSGEFCDASCASSSLSSTTIGWQAFLAPRFYKLATVNGPWNKTQHTMSNRLMTIVWAIIISLCCWICTLGGGQHFWWRGYSCCWGQCWWSTAEFGCFWSRSVHVLSSSNSNLCSFSYMPLFNSFLVRGQPSLCNVCRIKNFPQCMLSPLWMGRQWCW